MHWGCAEASSSTSRVASVLITSRQCGVWLQGRQSGLPRSLTLAECGVRQPATGGEPTFSNSPILLLSYYYHKQSVRRQDLAAVFRSSLPSPPYHLNVFVLSLHQHTIYSPWTAFRLFRMIPPIRPQVLLTTAWEPLCRRRGAAARRKSVSSGTARHGSR